jgi:hypothetical protein
LNGRSLPSGFSRNVQQRNCTGVRIERKKYERRPAAMNDGAIMQTVGTGRGAKNRGQ